MKIWGIIVFVLGLILGFVTMGYSDQFGMIVPLLMFVIALAGLVIFFWDTLKGWFGKGGNPPMMPPQQ